MRRYKNNKKLFLCRRRKKRNNARNVDISTQVTEAQQRESRPNKHFTLSYKRKKRQINNGLLNYRTKQLKQGNTQETGRNGESHISETSTSNNEILISNSETQQLDRVEIYDRFPENTLTSNSETQQIVHDEIYDGVSEKMLAPNCEKPQLDRDEICDGCTEKTNGEFYTIEGIPDPSRDPCLDEINGRFIVDGQFFLRSLRSLETHRYHCLKSNDGYFQLVSSSIKLMTWTLKFACPYCKITRIVTSEPTENVRQYSTSDSAVWGFMSTGSGHHNQEEVFSSMGIKSIDKKTFKKKEEKLGKILAKLACGLHKPNRQTVLPHESVEILYQTLSVKKIRNLGGKFGYEVVEKLGCKTMSDLAKFTEKELQDRYDEKNGSWLYNIARGYDFEPVNARLVSKSIGCCKKFPGRTALKTSKDVYHWLNKLAEELSERLFEDETMNKRKAQLLTVSMSLEINKIDTACSKSVSLTSYNIDKIFSQAEALLKKSCKIDSNTDVWSPPIKYLGLSAGKFSDITKNKIDKFFKISETPLVKNIPPEPDCELDQNRVLAEDKEMLISNESNKPSFFEKRLTKEINSSGKKLKIVPDFTRNDLISDSDDSQNSLIKVRNTSVDAEQSVTFRDYIKKNLFDTSLNDSSNQNKIIENNLKCNSSIVYTELNCVKSKSINQPQEKSKRKSSESNKSIASFFEHPPKSSSWTKPEELFPDLSQVDESILSFLPPSYKDKILKLKNENKVIPDNCGDSLRENISDSDIRHEMDDQIPHNQNIQNEGCGNFDDTNVSNSISVHGESIKMHQHNSDVECNAVHSSPPIGPECDDSNLFSKNTMQDNILVTSDYFIPSEYLVTCDECGQKVQNYELHKDMHFAKKLHQELNSNNQMTTVICINKDKNSTEKRKKSINSKSSSSNSRKVRKIDAYFKS